MQKLYRYGLLSIGFCLVVMVSSCISTASAGKNDTVGRRNTNRDKRDILLIFTGSDWSQEAANFSKNILTDIEGSLSFTTSDDIHSIISLLDSNRDLYLYYPSGITDTVLDYLERQLLLCGRHNVFQVHSPKTAKNNNRSHAPMCSMQIPFLCSFQALRFLITQAEFPR